MEIHSNRNGAIFDAIDQYWRVDLVHESDIVHESDVSNQSGNSNSSQNNNIATPNTGTFPFLLFLYYSWEKPVKVPW